MRTSFRNVCGRKICGKVQIYTSGQCATHTHTPIYRVRRYQNGKTKLDFAEARDSEWQWHQLGHMQVCTSLQTDNHVTPHHSVFYRPDALPATQPTVSKQ